MSLAIEIPRDTGDLTPAGVLGLPIAVATSAGLASGEEGLHILICQPEIAATAHVLLPRGANAMISLPSLPLVAAGAVVSGEGLVVSGADAGGGALIIGLSRDGEMVWRSPLGGPPPVRWPVPFAMPEPVVVWQVLANQIEIAGINGGVLQAESAVRTGGPPLALAGAGGMLWAVWAEGGSVAGLMHDRAGTSLFRVADGAADAIAVGALDRQGWVAWTAAGATFLAEPGSTPGEIELSRAAGGALAIIPGRFPVVWAQQTALDDYGDRIYVSALARRGRPPILFEGLVHAVAWWGEWLAVLGATDLWLLASTGDGFEE